MGEGVVGSNLRGKPGFISLRTFSSFVFSKYIRGELKGRFSGEGTVYL